MANGYLARAEIERLLAGYKADGKRLEPFGFKVYSQGDEDGVIEEIMTRLKIDKGVFLEIGVENGLECNSLYLLHKGWRGYWIEGNGAHKAFMEDKFGYVLKNKRLSIGFAMVSRENVNNICSQVKPADTEIDFLSIDIDGNDIYLFEALESRPKVVCIEYNAKFPANISKKQVYDPKRHWAGTDYMGSSLKALDEVGRKKGYRLVATNLTGANAFFVRSDLAGDLFTADDTPEYLHNPPRYYLIFDHYHHIGHRADFGPYVDLI